MEESKKNFKRRKQLIVEKAFQGRVIWRFVQVAVLNIFFSQFVIIGFFKIREWMNPSGEEMIYFSDTLNASLGFTKTLEILWLPLLISAILGSIVVLTFAIFYSHQIAGPLFNLKRMLRQIAAGKLNGFMRIRKNDEFHDIEHEFNEMVSNLNQKIIKLENELMKLPGVDKKKLEKVFENTQIELQR